MMDNHRRLLLTVAALALLGCGEDEAPEEIIRPVRSEQVFATGGTRVRTFSGAARAAVEAPLSFRVAGIVLRVPVNVGTIVSVGQQIAQLDPEDYQLQLQDAQAALRQSEATARNADGTYGRTRGLYEANNASLNDLEAARAGFEAATAQVQSLENRVALARQNVGYTRLTAPRDGAIAAVYVEPNQNVQVGQQVVLLTSGAELEVGVSVPEVLIAGISEGDAVSVTFDALPGRELRASVTEVGVISGQFATTFPVTVTLETGEPDVRPGMAAEVAFTFRATDDLERFFVPVVAVGEDRTGRFVWVVEPQDTGFGVVHRREVTVGELTSDGLEIVQGLADGEDVVTTGTGQLTEGLTVRLMPDAESGS